ncbi:hypothetical protein [Burkholderia gladioli]|uniref:hypothetical protein n=1 Tax=Burkholderia gladioli TaxID=28095 RepID=UPI0011B1EAA7|nr:hypothetical protein [Burkholderia gladioli]
MKNISAVFNTDRINRYGYKFEIAALKSVLDQGWLGSPSFISHDYHRLMGWSRALGLYIRPGEVRLMGNVTIPEGEEEYELVRALAEDYLQNRIMNVHSDERKKISELAGSHFSGNEIFMSRECSSVIDEGIAKRMFPDLFPTDEEDKRGLINIKRLNYIGPGVFEYAGCALFAHRFFRRSLSQINSLNQPFLRALFDLKDIGDLNVQIALDPNSIGLPETYKTQIELEYWWGPSFNEDLTSIPPGVTVHRASERLRLFHGIDQMEFWWHQQNEIQTLEAEEIICNETFGSKFNLANRYEEAYGFRYVHSMIDAKTKLPYHLDGAIREYNVSEYIDRVDRIISNAGKVSRYVKLWRVDGPIKIDRWKELICHFYRDNKLAGEYLGGNDSKSVDNALIFDEKPASSVASSFELLAPPVISDDFGLQAAITYHRKSEEACGDDCLIIAPGRILIAGESHLIIEYSSLDYIKMLNESIVGSIKICDKAKFVCYDDLDINFPIIYLSGDNVVLNANSVLRCLWVMCNEFVRRADRRFITINVSLALVDKVVKIGFAAFSDDLVRALPSGIPMLQSVEAIDCWMALIHKSINQGDVDSHAAPPAGHLMQSSGDFYLARKFVPEQCSLEINDAGDGLLGLPDSDPRTTEMFNSKRWRLSPVRVIYKSLCKNCGAEYEKCACKVLLSPSLFSVEVVESDLMSFIVTDRSASPI